MTIICGDCLEEMRKMEDNSINAIVTDPPYGLSFMGKGWDYAVPNSDYWKECWRISKPGSFLIAMGGTRTFHRLTCAIENAGFEIRDCISWLYGSGFPKSHNNFGLEGYGTALKPAWEPCIVAMKPLDGTFKQNAERWGQAGINIDGCRIETDENRSRPFGPQNNANTYSRGWNGVKTESHPKGRWPANVLFDEEAAKMMDEQSGISKSIYSDTMQPIKTSKGCKGGAYGNPEALRPDGHEKSDRFVRGGFSDSGGASRFFYCAKASSKERNEGLCELPSKEVHRFGKGIGEGKDPNAPAIDKNNHPTVKPLKLMEYLIKLVMPPKDGILLDPFAGSGTTILAAYKLGLKAIGIEKQPEYAEIAKKRLSYFEEKQSKCI